MKNTVICFRITNELRGALKRISETDRRSLSSTIENILHAHLDERRLGETTEEKRRHPRKTILVPALVSTPDGTVRAGVVSDVSLGGICVAAAPDFPCAAGEDFRISVVFSMPKSDTPLAIRCIPRHVEPGAQPGAQVRIGASFIEDGCREYEVIRRHLMN